jgi:hypothetical protein
MTKAIAYFLPQYHEIPENNEWWGEGFTEWTNLKKAKPLFKGHQINEPLNDNYYNLLNKSTVIWQTELAKKYSMHAFCYYHYWFKGRKILEKPAENLLEWKDIDQKFMFMWANHDWTRSWVGGREVLIKQEYGDESDWQSHAEYLIQFFKDDRYVKIGNKPVFQVYIPENISDFEKMVAVWDEACKRNGFDGIYIIENIRDYDVIKSKQFSPASNAVNIQEHSMAVLYWRTRNPISLFLKKLKKIFTGNALEALETYDIIARSSLEIMEKINSEVKVFFGVCTGWDNTPRYVKRGYIIPGATPEKFRDYLQKAKDLSEERKQEFIFISCWNEWCEGMCLEPTKKNGYEYLEAVKEVFDNNRTGV